MYLAHWLMQLCWYVILLIQDACIGIVIGHHYSLGTADLSEVTKYFFIV